MFSTNYIVKISKDDVTILHNIYDVKLYNIKRIILRNKFKVLSDIVLKLKNLYNIIEIINGGNNSNMYDNKLYDMRILRPMAKYKVSRDLFQRLKNLKDMMNIIDSVRDIENDSTSVIKEYDIVNVDDGSGGTFNNEYSNNNKCD